MKPNQIPLQIILNPRNAFTLVELMVAMALIILMLSIMSQAFVIATGTMQGLKEVADMQEKIRPAITLLQRDLGANHFEGSKKLSDPEFWDNGPPKEGYFMLWQDQAFEPAIPGIEPSGKEEAFPQSTETVNSINYTSKGVSFSRSAARANHMLAFTVKLPSKSPNEFFESSLGGAFGNTFFNGAGTPPSMTDSNIRRFEKDASLIHSEWAEVAYFLGPHVATNANYPSPTPDGYTDGKTGPALPYFNLYRQQRLVLPSYNVAGVNLPTPADNATNRDLVSELSFHPNENTVINNILNNILKFNSPSDLSVPWKRMGNRNYNQLGNPVGPLFLEFSNSNKVNTDIIATNVISFDVKLLTDDRYDYETLFTILGQIPYSTNLAFNNYSPSAVFDTWTTDQGGPAYPATFPPNPPNNLPIYDLGTFQNSKWAPSANLANPSFIPVWNRARNTGLNIKAVQISLRIWDQKSNTAKMFVVVQKL